MSSSTQKVFTGGLVEGSVDVRVYQDILKTHAKEAISFPDFGNLAITSVGQKTINRAQFTECEISPFRKYEIQCETSDEAAFNRESSIHEFSEKKIKFSDLQKLLIHSFSPNQTGNRPYPSAGGLYPIESLVFLFEERLTGSHDMISGCYHFRAVSKKLQLIKKMSINFFIEKLMHGFIKPQYPPCFCILYVAHIGKSIFKYRYRGYRHALMEVGSMYQQAITVSQQMDLRSTVWSTFSDHEMLYALDLDFGSYMPLTMQHFGYGD
jgi:SagB-type dehydrogenase family enzyme